MPWPVTLSISLILFVVAPFFRKWVDIVVWPKLQDWWAARSQATLRKRIDVLKSRLSIIEIQPASTDFEDMVLSGISVFLRLIIVIPGLAFSGYATFRTIQKVSLDKPLTLYLWCFLAVLYSIVWRWHSFFDNFRLSRSRTYRDRLRKELAELQLRGGGQ